MILPVAQGTPSTPDQEEDISVCLLSGCTGCAACQSAKALFAEEVCGNIERLLNQLPFDLADAKLEKQRHCLHFWRFTNGAERPYFCPRCDLSLVSSPTG
jgi:hypothetical protein